MSVWSHIPYADRPECKVCGNRPDDDGTLRHGKGCYVIDPDGGGEIKVGEQVMWLGDKATVCDIDGDEAWVKRASGRHGTAQLHDLRPLPPEPKVQWPSGETTISLWNTGNVSINTEPLPPPREDELARLTLNLREIARERQKGGGK